MSSRLVLGDGERAISKKGILLEAEKEPVRSLVRTYGNLVFCLEVVWRVLMKKRMGRQHKEEFL